MSAFIPETNGKSSRTEVEEDERMYCVDARPFETKVARATPDQLAAAQRLACDLRRLHRELLSRVGRICTEAAQTSALAQELAAKPLSQLADAVSALPGLADSIDPRAE